VNRCESVNPQGLEGFGNGGDREPEIRELELIDIEDLLDQGRKKKGESNTPCPLTHLFQNNCVGSPANVLSALRNSEYVAVYSPLSLTIPGKALVPSERTAFP
jgi:hypothetical protein